MAKYDITHACGHEWTWNLVGKSSYREWQQQRKAQEICPQCWKEQMQAASAQAAQSSSEAHPDWPALTGKSEKQINWGTDERQRLYDAYAARAVHAQNDTDRAIYLAALDEAIREHTEAHWYIDNRDTYSHQHALDDVMRKAITRMQQEQGAAPEPAAEPERSLLTMRLDDLDAYLDGALNIEVQQHVAGLKRQLILESQGTNVVVSDTARAFDRLLRAGAKDVLIRYCEQYRKWTLGKSDVHPTLPTEEA